MKLGLEQALYEIAQRTRSSHQATILLYESAADACCADGRSEEDTLHFVEAFLMTSAISGATPEQSVASAGLLSDSFRSGELTIPNLDAIRGWNPAFSEIIERRFGGNSKAILQHLAFQRYLKPALFVGDLLENFEGIRAVFTRTVPTIHQGLALAENAIARRASMKSEVEAAP